MNSKKEKKAISSWLFYVLVAYVFLQFTWWTYLLFELNNEVYRQRSELIIYKSANPGEIIREGNELSSKLHKKWIMIVGEATIFLIIMTIGIVQITKTHQKEANLVKQQKNFLLSVTHELKSPIASAKLQLQTIQKRDLDKEKQGEILANALADTERLNNLVENILLTATMDSDLSVAAKEKTNLSAFIEDTVKNIAPLIKQKIELNVERAVFYDIDTMSFPSIVTNLVENAAKYSPEKSTIKVALAKGSGKIILSVSDEGVAVPDNEKGNIFKKFYRVGNEDTRKTKGAGLGLYIVKNLVVQHEGEIKVKSNLPKGNVFEITFSV